MDTPITLAPELGLSFYIAIVVVLLVNGVKAIFTWMPTTLTNKIPDWFWVLWAMAFSIAATVVLKVDAMDKLFSAADIELPVTLRYIATGVAVGVSSNVLYKVATPIAKKLKNAQGDVVKVPNPNTDTTNDSTPTVTPTIPDDVIVEETPDPIPTIFSDNDAPKTTMIDIPTSTEEDATFGKARLLCDWGSNSSLPQFVFLIKPDGSYKMYEVEGRSQA